MAFWRRKPAPSLRHHSDHGSQYASLKYRQMLNMMKMEQNMSHRGNCWDNAPTERFLLFIKTGLSKCPVLLDHYTQK